MENDNDKIPRTATQKKKMKKSAREMKREKKGKKPPVV